MAGEYRPGAGKKLSPSRHVAHPLLVWHIEAPRMAPVAIVVHGPPPIAQVRVQDSQTFLQLLTTVERRLLPIECCLEELTFQADGALHQLLQTTRLVAQQALHFLDEVQDNARFLRQHPAQLVTARGQVSSIREGRDTPGELVFNEAAKAQQRQVAAAQ